MLTPNRRAPVSRACIRALRRTDTTTSGGFSEPDMNALAVIACGARRGPAVSTITPVAKRPSARRNTRSSSALGTSSTPPAYPTTPSAEGAQAVGVDQVLRLPPVEVVLGHARLGELLPAIVLARGQRPEERVAPDLLVASRVVDLVQLVPASELAPDRVPQELHQLDPLDRVDPARAPEVQVEVLPEVRRLEIAGVRVQVDEPAGHRLLDEVLHLHVGLGGQHLIGGGRLHAGQDAAAGPRVGGLGHRVRQSPDHVAPGDDLADVRLHSSERPGPGDLGGLDQEAGDEVELDGQPRAAVDEGAGEEAG